MTPFTGSLLRKTILFVSTLTALGCFLSCSRAASPEEIVLAYRDAFNAHNVDSLLSFYSDDIVFNIPDLQMRMAGKEALRGVAEYDSVLNTHMELTDITVSNDTVFCSIRETNDWMNTAGLSSAFYPKSIFVVSESRIVYLEADMADSSLHNWRSVLVSFFPWAQATYPSALDSVMSEGKFQFNAQSGAVYLELLKEWIDATDQ